MFSIQYSIVPAVFWHVFHLLQGFFHQSGLGSNFSWSLLYLICLMSNLRSCPPYVIAGDGGGGGGGGRGATKQIVFRFYILKG